MDVVKLRTLTEKSLIGFGKLKDKTVLYCLESTRHRTSLVAMYFKLSKINFTDDVLDNLHITKDFRIEKPGTDPNKYYNFLEGSYFYNMRYQIKGGGLMSGKKKLPSKGMLMSKNHGH